MNDTTFCTDALAELFYKNILETEDFSSFSQHCRVVGLILVRAAMIRSMERFDDMLMYEVPASWTLLDRRMRTVITMLGEIKYKRRSYKDEYGNTHYLLDEVLGIAPYQRFDKYAFMWVVRTASNIPYEKTARAFTDVTGCTITRQSVMRCVHKAGELLAQGAAGGAEALCIEYDGFWVNLQSERKSPPRPRRTYKEQFRKKSMEFRVWVAYCGKDKKKANKRIEPFHWASDVAPSKFSPSA
ncbi:MAG: UPF0236 family protein [Coriobacteriaceae bacterium]|jgi:hypothetical protein|nr:UPF0236 family protein [Coriobacteriaceae bacterium]